MGKCRVLKEYDAKITQGFKESHQAVDVVGDNGQDNLSGNLDYITAHSSGEVIDVITNIKGFKKNSYGNYVKLLHDNGMYTLYAHLEYGSVKVSKGTRVIQGEVIGFMGNTGNSHGAHLHFEVRDKNNKKVNPTSYLNADLPNNEEKEPTSNEITDEELLDMVRKTIRGDYGNGATRKCNLGENFSEVQLQVNLNYEHGTTNWDNVRLY